MPWNTCTDFKIQLQIPMQKEFHMKIKVLPFSAFPKHLQL